MEGKPNQLYGQGMRSFEQYDEICKYFTERKQRDNNANEIQKHLQLYDLSLGEYLVNKYVSKSDTVWNWAFNTPCKSLKGILVLFEEEQSYTRDTSKF